MALLVVSLSQGTRFGLFALDEQTRVFVGNAHSVAFTSIVPLLPNGSPIHRADIQLVVDAPHRLLLVWTPHLNAIRLGPSPPAVETPILHGIVLGDAYDLLDRLPEDSIDLIITSPPYWGHREYGLDHNWDLFNDIATVKRTFTVESSDYSAYRRRKGVLGLEPYPEWYIQHLAQILTKARRCLKSSGSMWVNIGDTYFARWASIRENGRQGLADEGRLRRKTPMGGFRQEKQLLPSRFAIAMQEEDWILRNDLIWHKPNVTPRPEGDRLKLSHEHLFHFVKKPREGRAAYYYDARSTEPRQSDVVRQRHSG